MSTIRKMRDYTYWALNYPVPQLQPSDEKYIYYSPYSRGAIPQGFHSYEEALSIDHSLASGLVPATSAARVQLALSYHQASDGGKAQVWSHGETGELIDWYESIGLWGTTAFNKRGKMGTIFARTREPLIERALRDPVIALPNALKHVRRLPGMEEISPVLLPHQQDQAEIKWQHSEIQIASDREPLYPPALWLVTLLYEDRHMITEHTSSTLPSVEEVLGSLYSRLRLFEQCADATSWSNEDMPYVVCEREAQHLKALLGTVYPDFLHAFGNVARLSGH